MSRGYEDEQLILQVFLMFINRSDSFGRFGVIGPQDENFELVKLSEVDLRVLLMCILYFYDRQMLEDYCLFDRMGNKSK